VNEELVPVVFAPTGEVDFYPQSCVDLLKIRRSLSPESRARMDKLGNLMQAGTWPYSIEQLQQMPHSEVVAAIDRLPDPGRPLESDAAAHRSSLGAQ
jgi:hypothetical protein